MRILKMRKMKIFSVNKIITATCVPTVLSPHIAHIKTPRVRTMITPKTAVPTYWLLLPRHLYDDLTIFDICPKRGIKFCSPLNDLETSMWVCACAMSLSILDMWSKGKYHTSNSNCPVKMPIFAHVQVKFIMVFRYLLIAISFCRPFEQRSTRIHF